jgi:Protein of unknown function (DUF3037)
MRHAFEYALLRVVPRIERGERLNAGVLLYCRALDHLGAAMHLDPARLAALDPAADPIAIGCVTPSASPTTTIVFAEIERICASLMCLSTSFGYRSASCSATPPPASSPTLPRGTSGDSARDGAATKPQEPCWRPRGRQRGFTAA